MPIYEFECRHCKTHENKPRVYEIIRPMSQSGDPHICLDCGATCERVYSFHRKKEFVAYQDDQYGCTISSYKQERRLMKSHGHIPVNETPAYDKFRQQRKLARKKPSYFTSAGYSKMERD